MAKPMTVDGLRGIVAQYQRDRCPEIKLGKGARERLLKMLEAEGVTVTAAPSTCFGVPLIESSLLPDFMGALIDHRGELTILDFRTEAERGAPVSRSPEGEG